MKKLIISALAIAAMVGCQKDDNLGGYDESSVVRFSSSSLTTKVNDAGTQWIKGDLIGITSFMNNSYSYNDYFNQPYSADKSSSTTTFTASPDAEVIRYRNNEDVGFVAYYPYSEDVLVTNVIPLDISDQSDISKLDFMISDPVNVEWDYANNSTETEVKFNFKHQLSKVVFNVTTRDNIESLEGLITTLDDVPTTAVASLEGGISDYDGATALKLNSKVIDKNSVVVTAVLFPAVSGSYQLNFHLGEIIVSATLTEEFKQGMQYNYNVKVGDDYVVFEGESSVTDWIDEKVDDSLDADHALGSIYNPMPISTLSDFRKIGSDQESWSKQSHYVLTNDIDFGASRGVNWQPLCSSFNDPFCGTIDGAGHKLHNIKIEGDSENQLVGLFAFLGIDAKMSNLTISNAVISSDYDGVGAFAAVSHFGAKFSNCAIENVTYNVSKGKVGGFVGTNSNSTLYLDGCCVTDVTINLDNSSSFITDVGGFVGYSNSKVNVTDCVVDKLNVSTTTTNGVLANYIGGFVGCMSDVFNAKNCLLRSTTIDGCFNSIGGYVGYCVKVVAITNCDVESSVIYSDSDSSGSSNCGGLLGDVEESYNMFDIQIAGCNVKDSKIGGLEHNVGGLVGRVMNYANFTIEDVAIDDNSSVTGYYKVGGFVGNTTNVEKFTIRNAKNHSSVVADYMYGAGLVGFVFDTGDLNISNSVNSGDINVKHGYGAGLVGYSESSKIIIANSLNSGNVTSKDSKIAGIIGAVSNLEQEAVTIVDCDNEGDISGTETIGGIVGLVNSNINIDRCRNSGAVVATNYLAGGVVGAIYDSGFSNNVVVINSSNSGKVSSESSDAGGIVGKVSALESNIMVANSYNSADVIGHSRCSGILGAVEHSDNINIRSCYNIGDVTSTFSSSDYFAGIVYVDKNIEPLSDGKVVDCYFLGDNELLKDDYAMPLSKEDIYSSQFVDRLNSESASLAPEFTPSRWVLGSNGYPVHDNY